MNKPKAALQNIYCPLISKARSLAGYLGENLARNFSGAFPHQFSFSLVKAREFQRLSWRQNVQLIEMSRELCECHVVFLFPEQVRSLPGVAEHTCSILYHDSLAGAAGSCSAATSGVPGLS